MKTKTVLSEYSKLLLTIYRQAQDLPVHEFQDGALSAIKAHLPFDSAMWGTARMTPAGADIHSLHLHNTKQAMVDAYEKVKHLGAAAARVTEKPAATMAFNAQEDFPQEELRAYREFLHQWGHENFFITSELNPITGFAHWVSLYRFDKDQRCKPEETELLSCLAPHLMQALAINRLVHLDRLTGDIAREKWAVALADSRGVLYHVDKRFRELVRMEWPVDGEVRLPQPLLDRLNVGENQITGAHVVIHRSLERGLLFLKARPREEVDELSAREFLVARLLASGLTRKQVAAKLERSPETIRSQAKTIFDKLGINNVAMLGPLLVLRD